MTVSGTPARRTRLLSLADVPVITALLTANRAFMAPSMPLTDDSYYTQPVQRMVAEDLLDQHHQGLQLPHVILRESGEVAGRITLRTIVRGAFQSATIGYWLNEADTGRGLATAAVAEMARIAFGPLGLHRIEASTLPANVASRRVLERNGFEEIGLAPSYLNIAGHWQDHLLFQLIHDAA